MAKRYYPTPGGSIVDSLAGAANIVSGIRDRMAVSQYNDALVDMNSQMTELTNSFATAQDYENFEQRFQDESARIQASIEEQHLKSARSKQLFADAWQQAYQRANGLMIDAMASKQVRHLQQQTVTNLNQVINTPPTITFPPAENEDVGEPPELRAPGGPRTEEISNENNPVQYIKAQENRINGIVNNAISAGLDRGAAEELRRNAITTLHVNQGQDLAFRATDALLAQGRSVEEVNGIVSKAIRLEGQDFFDFIESEGIRSAPFELQQLAQAYGSLELSPQQEEAILGNVEVEATREASSIARGRTQMQDEMMSQVIDTLLQPGGYAKVMKNGYEMIRGDLLSAGQKMTVQQMAEGLRRVADSEAEQLRRDRELEAAAQRWQKLDTRVEEVRESTRLISSLDDIPTARSDIEDARNQALKEPEDTARRIRLGEIAALERSLDMQELSIKAQMSESKEEQADLARQIEEANTERAYQAHLAQMDRQIATLEQNPDEQKILELVDDIYADPLLVEQEQDREERVDDLNRLFERIKPNQFDPNKTDPGVAAQIALKFADGNQSPDQLRGFIVSKVGNGLSGNDMDKWIGRLDDREAWLGNTWSENAIETIQKFYDAQMRDPGIGGAERARLATEYAYALDLYDQYLENNDYRQLPPDEQRRVYDSLLETVFQPVAARAVLGGLIEFEGGAPVVSMDALQQALDNGYKVVAQSIAQELRYDEWATFSNEKIGADYTSAGSYAVGLTDDGLIFTHKESGTQFRRTKRILGAWRWQYKEPGGDWNDWNRRFGNRMIEQYGE